MGFDKDSFRGYSGRQTGDFHRWPMVFWVLPSISMGNRAHSLDLSEFQFYSKTWLESSCQAPNDLLAPAILRSKCWYPPTAPRALKKGPFQSPSTFKPKKTYQQKQWIYRLGWILNHRLILKLRFALKNPNSKRFGGSIKSSQILTKLCETIQYTETPKTKVDQTTIIISSFLRLPTTFSQMNSTKSRRPCWAAQCIGVKPFSYLNTWVFSVCLVVSIIAFQRIYSTLETKNCICDGKW